MERRSLTFSIFLAFSMILVETGLVLANGHGPMPSGPIRLSPRAYLALIAGASLILITSLWVLADARKLGAGKQPIDGLKTLGPWGWFGATLGIWVLAFPLYIWSRSKIRKSGRE